MQLTSLNKVTQTIRGYQHKARNNHLQTPNSCLFKELSDESLQTLLTHAHTQDYEANNEIVQQGDQPEWLYLILEGQVKTVRYSNEGHESTIRMLIAGDTFMDAVIFMGNQSPIHAVAVEKCTLLLIPADIVRQHVSNDPQFSRNLLDIITLHYKNAMQQIDCIINKTPIERLGYYFLRLHFEQNPSSTEFDLAFSKSMIANHLGMTPETFSRALAQLKKLGINVEQKHISLKNSFALCQFCDPDMASCCPRSESEKCPNTEACRGIRKNAKP